MTFCDFCELLLGQNLPRTIPHLPICVEAQGWLFYVCVAGHGCPGSDSEAAIPGVSMRVFLDEVNTALADSTVGLPTRVRTSSKGPTRTRAELRAHICLAVLGWDHGLLPSDPDWTNAVGSPTRSPAGQSWDHSAPIILSASSLQCLSLSHHPITPTCLVNKYSRKAHHNLAQW